MRSVVTANVDQTVNRFQDVQPGNAGELAENAWAHQLEPSSLIKTFVNHPPLSGGEEQPRTPGAGANLIAFEVLQIGEAMPCFLVMFDLLTTMDHPPRWLSRLLNRFGFIRQLLKYPTLFAGTTVSEYCLVPRLPCFKTLLHSLLDTMHERRAQFTIIKDIPFDSPLLSADENQQALRLLDQCKEAGFTIVGGQALAYVKIDFHSIDEYLKRVSRTRRKDLRRKIRSESGLIVKEAKAGDAIFYDDHFLDEFYSLYLNVYRKSQVHFDRLTMLFFRDVLQNKKGNGIVFLYYLGERLIGWNICFIHNRCLVDKYVGFAYPEARDANLYFVSWFKNLEYALKHHLRYYIAGWTDPQVKASLGASFTLTQHAVYVRNPLLKMVLKPFQRFFESDLNWSEQHNQSATQQFHKMNEEFDQ